MKGLKKRTMFIVLLLLLVFSTASLADNSIKIINWLTNAVLMDNGDLNIVEDIEFKFDGDYNGVFRNIKLKDIDSVEDISLSQVEGDIKYRKVTTANNGDAGVFTVNEDNDELEIKIYSPSNDESKTFRISYTVKGVPIKYKDTAELNYNFIGQENDTEIDRFEAILKLPNTFNSKQVKIFGHGPLQGKVDYLGEDSIKVEVDDIYGGENVTLKTLFPTRFIKNSTNTRDELAYERIMNEEFEKIEIIEKKNLLKDTMSSVMLYLGIGALIVVSVVMLIFRRKQSSENGDIENVNIYMEKTTPAVVSILLNSLVSDQTIVATMLDLARKGYIDIEVDEDSKYSNAIITRKRNVDERLTESEKHFLDFFLDKVGNTKSVSTENIKMYSEKNKLSFSTFITKWTEKVMTQMKNEDYYDPRDKKIGKAIMIIFGIVLIISFIFFIYIGENRMIKGSLLVLMSFIGLIYGIYVYSRKSNEGYREYKAWRKFKSDMNSIRKEKQENIDLNQILKYPLESSLIYSVATGVNQSVIDIFKSKIKRNEGEYLNSSVSPWFLWYVFYGGNFNNNIKQSIANSAPYSGSDLGTGGGFTGGGGGAGGGGAGGF